MRALHSSVVLMVVLAVSGLPVAAEDGVRSEDPVGDAVGSSPDIVAVTISEPEADGPVLRFEVEFAAEPPLGTDMETYTDVVFISFATDVVAPSVVEIEKDDAVIDYTIGAHGVTLPIALESGGHLSEAGERGELWWHVVDVSVEGPRLAFTLDRKLIGDPDSIAWAVLVGREGGSEGAEAQFDAYPEIGEPYVTYELIKPWR